MSFGGNWIDVLLLSKVTKGLSVIITVAAQKGGSGKSTIAINAALILAGLKKKPTVALVDTDRQRSCIQTLQGHERDNLKVYETTEKPTEVIQGLSEQYTIVDTPPHSHEVAYVAAALSDLVVIPVQPSPLDIRAAADTVKALQIIQGHRPDLQCCFLVNRIAGGTILAKEIKSTLERFYPFPVLETMLHDRQAYKQSLITGQSVLEYDKRSAAAQEMGKLVLEIIKKDKAK